MDSLTSYNGLNAALVPSSSLSNACATAPPPAPPLPRTSQGTSSTPSALHAARTASSSAGVSPVKWLRATRAGRPNFFTLRMWRRRFSEPRCTAAGSAAPSCSFFTPPCIFNARTVATMIAASGLSPANRHLMSRNFSAPRSAPKPASVSTMSASARPSLVATTELQPCAMLPNGPQCTSAGPPSSVWTRFGLIASLSSSVMAPCEVLQPGGEREDRHDLRARDDDEPLLARRTAVHPTQSDDDVAQRAVVHVDRARPADAADVDAERVAVMEVRVEHRREQIVRAADGVEVAGEVKVDVLHRHDLRVAAARRSALHAEDRAERRLPHRENRVLAQFSQRLRDAHGDSGLAFAGRRGIDPGDQHEAALGLAPLQRLERDLRLVFAVRLQLVVRQAQLRRDVGDRPELRGLRDRDVGRDLGRGRGHSARSMRCPKQRRAFSVVRFASVARSSPRNTAARSATARTKPGSLRLPRCGAGAR